MSYPIIGAQKFLQAWVTKISFTFKNRRAIVSGGNRVVFSRFLDLHGNLGNVTEKLVSSVI